MVAHPYKPSVNLAQKTDDDLRKKYADEKAKDALINEGGINEVAPPDTSRSSVDPRDKL